MPEIVIGKEGRIVLPESRLLSQPLTPGTGLIFEPSEHGLRLHYARPDARRAYIEVTSRCNLSCVMCVRQSWREPQGSMEAKVFQAVLEGLKAFPNLERVVIGGFGEPLMHPGIVDIVAALRALGLGVTMSTNGLLLERSLAEALLQAGVDTLIVSLDSMHIQAYRQSSLTYGVDRILENLQGLHGLIRDCGWRLPAVGLEYVVTRSNLAELSRLPDVAKQLGASFVIVTNLLPHTLEMVSETLYDRDEPLLLGGGWGIQRAGWIAWGTPNLPRMKWGAVRQCKFIKEPAMVIGWDGGVSPCYALMHSYPYYIYGRQKQVDRFVLGFVGERSLAEIWTSEEYVTFRAKVRDFRFPSCVDCGKDCSYAQENGDCWGNDPSCADCLWAQDIIRCP